MRLIRLVAVLAAVTAVALAEKVRYDNYHVYKVTPHSEEQVAMLATFEHLSTDFAFWKSPSRVGVDAHVLVAPHKRNHFKDIMETADLKYGLVIHNVQQALDDEEERLANKAIDEFDWTDYHNLEEIHAWLEALAAKFPSVKVVSAGSSYEGREVLGIEITNGAELPGVIFEAGIHAREWISPATSSWIINEILNAPANSTFKQFNYVYFPVINPDGYSFTWTGDRAWRKTRQPYKLAGILTCYGADPNRNWGYHWLDGGASTNPCSETYAGPNAFSEPEMQALADYYTANSARNDIYVAFHSYSQIITYPWGYTGDDTPLEATWKRIGNQAADALKAVYGTSYEVGSIYDAIYLSSGSSLEWYYGTFNNTLAFEFELRDTGDYGFFLPPEQIIPSGQETIAAVEVFLKEYQKLKKN